MTVSHLTRSRNQLWSDLLTALGGSGSEVTMSEKELIAACVNTYAGTTVSHLTSSRTALIAELATRGGATVSGLQQSDAALMAAYDVALGLSTSSALDTLFDALLAGAANTATGDTDASETTDFLARTTGLDVTHTNAYKELINGLVADGVFAKFDALYILATQDSTTAVLNLVSASYALTTGGIPTFTADRGYIGVADGFSTGFNPTTAGSPKFVLNSAHFSVWNNTNATSAAATIGDNNTLVYIKHPNGNFYARVNDVSSGGYAVANPIGFLIGNRSASNAVQTYQNGASLGSDTTASVAVENGTVRIIDAAGTDTVHQIAAVSIGGSLSAGDVTNFYNRMRTYMTAVGVP